MIYQRRRGDNEKAIHNQRPHTAESTAAGRSQEPKGSTSVVSLGAFHRKSPLHFPPSQVVVVCCCSLFVVFLPSEVTTLPPPSRAQQHDGSSARPPAQRGGVVNPGHPRFSPMTRGSGVRAIPSSALSPSLLIALIFPAVCLFVIIATLHQ